jgi:hypothetical protein
MPPSIEHVRAGRLRALAVTTSKRTELLPELPTVAEFLPGYDAEAWFGVGAPHNTPIEIIEKLNREINAVFARLEESSHRRSWPLENHGDSRYEFIRQFLMHALPRETCQLSFFARISAMDPTRYDSIRISKPTLDDIIVRRPICLFPPIEQRWFQASAHSGRRKHENPDHWLDRVGSGGGFHPAGMESECAPDHGKSGQAKKPYVMFLQAATVRRAYSRRELWNKKESGGV